MLSACVSEHHWSHGDFHLSVDFVVLLHEVSEWALTIIEEGLETSSEHLLKTQGHDTLGLTASDGFVGQVESSATSGAVVVDVNHGNTGVSKGVDGLLAAARISVNIAAEDLLDLVLEVDARVIECPPHGDVGQVVVLVGVLARPEELGHSIADHEYASLVQVGIHLDVRMFYYFIVFLFVSIKIR